MEIWRDVVGYEGVYEVSDYGRVRSKEKYLKQTNSKGYKSVTLKKDENRRQYRVHRLVGFAFIPNPDNKPYINHIDGVKDNNKVENLEWCTQKENIRHAIDTGLMKSLYGESNGSSKLSESEVFKIRSLYHEKGYKQKKLATIFGVERSTISKIVSENNWLSLERYEGVKRESRYLGKLKEGDVIKIRGLLASGTSNVKMLSEEYGVTQVTIRQIRDRITWKNIS